MEGAADGRKENKIVFIQYTDFVVCYPAQLAEKKRKTMKRAYRIMSMSTHPRRFGLRKPKRFLWQVYREADFTKNP